MDDIICKHFGFEDKTIQLEEWERLITNIKHAKYEVKIALIGKYTSIRDSYISVNESLKHAGYALNANVNIVPVDAEGITRENADSLLREYGGIVVPGGFGERAIEGIINAIEYARVHKKPFLGICLGMQLAVIEFTRHVLGFTDAHSTEFNPSTSIPIIDLGTCKRDLVNPMRLGLYPCNLIEGTLARSIYNESSIEERHRHRFELNMKYASLFEGSDLIFSGVSPSGDIVEIVEDKNHPFFIACQFHPEFLSRPNRAHPIFYSFVKHSMEE
jgi:CTP synthase